MTIAAIVALGLAIGSTTAIFSVVNAVLLKPLSFDEPDRVAIVWESNPGRGLDLLSTDLPSGSAAPQPEHPAGREIPD